MTGTLPTPSPDAVPEDPTAAARQQRWRDRQKGKLPPAPKLTCVACGIVHTGARGVHCSRCWEKCTPEGRRFKSDRVQKVARRKAESAKQARDQP